MPLFTSIAIVGTKMILGKMGIGHGLLLLGKKKIISDVGRVAYKKLIQDNLTNNDYDFAKAANEEIQDNIDGVKKEGWDYLVTRIK